MKTCTIEGVVFWFASLFGYLVKFVVYVMDLRNTYLYRTYIVLKLKNPLGEI